MRILHIDTERGWRGGERQALWLAEALRRRGHDVIVAARPNEPLATRAAASGLRVFASAPAFESDPRAVLQLRRLIRDGGIDIVHTHTGHAAGLGALATVGTDTPLVVARRVDFPLRRNVVTRWKYRRAGVIVAISQAVADVIARSGIDPDKIAIVTDGTDTERTIDRAPPRVLESLGVVPHGPLVVQVAQLVPHKDPLNFVHAIAAARKRLPDLQAILVGDGPLRNDVVAAVRALELEENLHVAGYRQDADSLLAAADVVVLSSKEEGMGSVLLDAMLLGKPIAATRAGGIPEIIEHDVTGLLAPVGDPSALGNHIVTLLEDRALANRLARSARSRVEDFSIERLTDRTLAIYERLLSRVPADDVEPTSRLTAAASRASSPSSTRAP
jgi:glycosyltransferase involved in cell wall biosynthesis